MSKLKDFLTLNDIHLDLSASTKNEVLAELSAFFSHEKVINHRRVYLDALKREEEITTGIGNGIAIPHAKSVAVITPSVVFGRTKMPIDYQALDNKPVDLFFMIAIPKNESALHLELLALIAQVLMDHQKVAILRTTTDLKTIYDILTN